MCSFFLSNFNNLWKILILSSPAFKFLPPCKKRPLSYPNPLNSPQDFWPSSNAKCQKFVFTFNFLLFTCALEKRSETDDFNSDNFSFRFQKVRFRKIRIRIQVRSRLRQLGKLAELSEEVRLQLAQDRNVRQHFGRFFIWKTKMLKRIVCVTFNS